MTVCRTVVGTCHLLLQNWNLTPGDVETGVEQRKDRSEGVRRRCSDRAGVYARGTRVQDLAKAMANGPLSEAHRDS